MTLLYWYRCYSISLIEQQAIDVYELILSINNAAVQFSFRPSYQQVSEGSEAALLCIELLSGIISKSFDIELTKSSGSASKLKMRSRTYINQCF